LDGREFMQEPVTEETLNVLSGQIVDAAVKVHKAQVLSYLKLSGKQVGLLLNFNVELMKNGIKRIVNNL
jgi:GxxExxY protein